MGLLDIGHSLALEELHRALGESGFEEIRSGHGCVFGNIQPEGSRLTELAEASGLTKQAVGEVVADLERMGYVERTPDPADGRAKIIRLTDRGQAALDVGNAALDGVEQRWAERYGEERVAAMRDLLEEIAADHWPRPRPR